MCPGDGLEATSHMSEGAEGVVSLQNSAAAEIRLLLLYVDCRGRAFPVSPEVFLRQLDKLLVI